MANDKGFEDLVVDRLVSQMDTFADAVASQLGMPPEGKRYTPQEEAEQWSFSPVADPDQRAQQMMQMYQQGMSVEDITDQIYPNRRRLVTAGRPSPKEQIQFAEQMDRRMARMARDQGHHIPGVEPWDTITQENAPPPEDAQASSAPTGVSFPPESAGPAPAPAGVLPGAPAGAPTPPPAPGWADPGGQFGLTGPQL